MINTSNAFREKLEAGEPVRMVVNITFPGGTKKTIDEEIMNGDNGFTDCAESSSFPVFTFHNVSINTGKSIIQRKYERLYIPQCFY